MGAPYGQAVTQWSDGSYPGADNTEDDLAIIAANGAPWLTDDAGDVASSALPLALDASRIGLLNTTADLDTYSVTVGAGLLTATAEPSWPGPNVDLSVTLRDSAGTVLASAAPAFSASQVRTSLSAAVSLVVPAGTYTVEVEGVGNGNPGSAGASDYGSVGWYSVVASGIAPTTSTPTPTPSATPTATQTNPTSPGPTPTTSAPAPPGGSSSSPPTTSESPPSTESPGSPAGPTVAVAVRALGVESRTLPAAKKRVSYRTTLVAAGGSGGYTWKRTKGKLPKGLKLSRAGVLSGKAATKVSARFRVRVTDSSGARSTAWVRLRVR